MRKKSYGVRALSLGALLLWAAPGNAGGDPTVVIEKGILAFNPQEVTIKKGGEIHWKNEDEQTHFLTGSKTSERLSDELEVKTTQEDLLLFKALDPGEAYEKSFTDVGTFYYFCGIHNKMWGKITVEE